jgi:hypothetical protein
VHSAEIQCFHLQAEEYPGQHRISCALCWNLKFNAATYRLKDTQANTESAVHSAEIQCCHLHTDG